MQSLKDDLEHVCVQAFLALGFDPAFAALQESDRPDLADFQCNGALAVAKFGRVNPREVAGKIVATIPADGRFIIDVAGPGFLNFRLSDAALPDMRKPCATTREQLCHRPHRRTTSCSTMAARTLPRKCMSGICGLRSSDSRYGISLSSQDIRSKVTSTWVTGVCRWGN